MLYRKKGLPDEGEVLLCTVKQIQPNSVFVSLDEYNTASGMIHISEIAPGRIRNIRDFVKESKKIVCVVLRVHADRGHIDLSLRRVNETQKKKKIEYIKQIQKAEKIIEFVAKNNKLTTEAVYNELMAKVDKDYPDLFAFFSSIIMDEAKMSDYANPSYSKQLEDVVRQRIKPPEVEIEGAFKIESYAPDGAGIIKAAFANVDQSKVSLAYLGGGKYQVKLTSPNYKEGEEILDIVTTQVTESLEKAHASVSFNRIEKKK